jgi:hypothetical protein
MSAANEEPAPPPDALPSPPDPVPSTPTPPSSSPAPLTRFQRRERAVGDALRTLIRDLEVDRFGAPRPQAPPLKLTVSLTVQPTENWTLAFEPGLADQLARQIEEAEAQRAVFQPGRLYCFRCESSGCEHAAPPSPAAVFKGYTSTGTPEWHDLHQAFIEARDARVDQLFHGRSHVVTLVQLGRDLKARQLASFGRSSRTYAVLGQVVAGYYPVARRGAVNELPDRLAFTFQAVETRGAGGQLRLRLSTIARPPDGVDLDELLVTDLAWVYRARELTARALEGLERRADAARAASNADDLQAAMRRVPSVLHRLAEFLERGARQGQRRTRHVEERRQEHRPVHKAVEDARTVPDSAIYYDEKAGTLVACADQGRAHVFSADGRHVTSFTLRPDSIAFRLRTQRWRPAAAEEIRGLREKLTAT